MTSPQTALDAETRDLVDRWIVAFCEAPAVIDAELMRAVLADHDAADAETAR